MNTIAALALVAVVGGGLWVAQSRSANSSAPPKALPTQLGKGELAKGSTTQKLVVGGGCFWCIEAQFEMVKGVTQVISGYAGGEMKDPNYTAVMTGQTGHAEAIEIHFDPSKISRADLLRVFFVAHDPTTLNRQGNDVGTQYRSVIFFSSQEEKSLAEKIRAELVGERVYSNPIVTTIEPLEKFYKAEDYHQDYFAKFEKASPEERAKMNGGYCSYVVAPKVEAFRQKLAHLLK